MREDDELSMDKIQDYNNKESLKTRKTIRLVIVVCLIIGAVFAFFKSSFNQVDDYVGTEQNPGIDTSKR